MGQPSTLDSVAKRAKLASAKNPYWHGIAGGRGGVSLGYRKPKHGPGRWVVKLVAAGERIEEKLAPADDVNAEPDAISFAAAIARALDWAKGRAAALESQRRGEALVVPTVLQALELYASTHAVRIGKLKSYMAGTFARHVSPYTAFTSTPLDKVTATKIQTWRAAFIKAAEARDEPLTPRTVNSILSQVRAALNYAAEMHRSQLPAGLPAEIRHGTKAVPGDRNAREHQILPSSEIRRLVEAAFAGDDTGDFGRLVLVLAATGARFSQVARLTVADVQAHRARIMMPPAMKGRRPKEGPPAAIPVGEDVIAQLRPALDGRRGQERLLLRWHHERMNGAADSGWKRFDRRPWPTSTTARHEWAATLARADMPDDTIMMCFRHSSIVNGLAAGLPVRLVAALHDTSVQMIEEHYSAYIVDATEELARRAITPLTSTYAAPIRPAVEAVA